MPTMSHHNTAVATGPWTAKPPTPPPVIIPTLRLSWTEPMKIVPNYQSIDPASLSKEDLDIITQNGREQIAQDNVTKWSYNDRRYAHQILDFLYLGPLTVVRDKEWLRANGITLLVAIRDERQAKLNIMGGNKVAKELGIEAANIDVIGYDQLVRIFPIANQAINNHMLRIFREQAVSNPNLPHQDDQMVIDQSNFRRGKVLVFCETGNDRSACIVLGYLMAVLGMSLVDAFHFVTYKRFCISIDDNLKRILSSYEELLAAMRTVHQHELHLQNFPPALQYEGLPRFIVQKRTIDEMVEDDDLDRFMAAGSGSVLDEERFFNRTHTPFVDN
ncbi:phosphatases II [Xylariaceae sp. FL0255]|nr:phosphatases II [Xylariaceae sp. FL0255]